MGKKANRQVEPMLSLVTSRNDFEVKYKCLSCGEACPDLSLVCPHCESEHSVSVDEESLPFHTERKGAKLASRIKAEAPHFVPTGSQAWDEVLGGGAVRPSTIMVHGPKGTGKTTSVLSIALKLAERLRGYLLWGSSEMPEMLVRQYADRIGATSKDLARMLISDDGRTETMLDDIEEFEPCVVIWDSIQRYTWKEELGETELQNVVHAAMHAGSDAGAITILLSQVTKQGDYLGTSGLGHDVDVLVELKRECDSLRLECPEKNRFASTPRAATVTKAISSRVNA